MLHTKHKFLCISLQSSQELCMVVILQINLKPLLSLQEMCFCERILSRLTIHLPIHVLPVLLGYVEVLISMKEHKNWLTKTFPCGIGDLSRDCKISRNWSRRLRRGVVACDYHWTKGTGKHYLFYSRHGLFTYFWSSGYEKRKKFTKLEGVFGKFRKRSLIFFLIRCWPYSCHSTSYQLPKEKCK